MKIFIVVSTVICFALPVFAQAPATVPARLEIPTGPLLRAPADFSKWEIAFVYAERHRRKEKLAHTSKEATETSAPHLARLVTVKTGRIIHIVSVDMLHKTTEVWFDAETQYTRVDDQAVWSRADGLPVGNAGINPDYNPLPSIGYRDMDLVKEENYAGMLSYGERTCLIFVPGGVQALKLDNAGDVQKKLKNAETIACVDADTRLPVEVRNHGETRIFQFDTPPAAMQALPPDLLAQISEGNDARARLNQPAPRPY